MFLIHLALLVQNPPGNGTLPSWHLFLTHLALVPYTPALILSPHPALAPYPPGTGISRHQPHPPAPVSAPKHLTQHHELPTKQIHVYDAIISITDLLPPHSLNALHPHISLQPRLHQQGQKEKVVRKDLLVHSCSIFKKLVKISFILKCLQSRCFLFSLIFI